MAAKTAASHRVINPILTNVVRGYKAQNLAGAALFPDVPVNQRGGKVIEFGKEAFRVYNAARPPGANRKRISIAYSDTEYTLHPDSLEGKVPYEFMEEAQAGPSINLGTRTVQTVMQSLRLGLEVEQAKLATTAANYSADHKLTLDDTAGKEKWSNDTVTPTKLIDAAKDVIRSSVGLYPNVLVLSPTAWRALKNNQNYAEKLKYVDRDSITVGMMQNILEIPRIVVAQSVQLNDSTDKFGDIWGNFAVLAYVARPSTMEEPSFGYNYVLRGHPIATQAYNDPSCDSWMYPVNFERKSVICGKDAGFLFSGVA